MLSYADLRAVHCRSECGRASCDVGCFDRHFPIVGCAEDGAKRGFLEALTHVHQLAVKAWVFRTDRCGFVHKVVDRDVIDLAVLDPHGFLRCDGIDIGERRVLALLGQLVNFKRVPVDVMKVVLGWLAANLHANLLSIEYDRMLTWRFNRWPRFFIRIAEA